ncbi:MAG: hypothetical protein KDD50_09740 [Bdellovibrionales bacterium]|nr:hypothetical protein [Bdellovibrionales bacterium]
MEKQKNDSNTVFEIHIQIKNNGYGFKLSAKRSWLVSIVLIFMRLTLT